MNSCVYFIRAGARGPIKIGLAVDVGQRMRSLQTASPTLLELIGAIPGGLKLEKAIHRRLAEFRLHGEWFKPTLEVRQWAQLARIIDGRHPEEIDLETLHDDARQAFKRLRLLPEGQDLKSRRDLYPGVDKSV